MKKEGLVQLMKDGEGWFRLPNILIDTHLDILGSRGVALYALIARQTVMWEYPDVIDMAAVLKVSPRKVKQLLFKLEELGLLNVSDMKALMGNEYEEFILGAK